MTIEVEGVAATTEQKTSILQGLGAAEHRAALAAATDFTLTATHANRRVDCTKGTAQAVTWNTGHGMVHGDSGRLVQVGAGAITITKDGGFTAGDLSLSTGVASATTVNDGDVLDWEYRLVGAVEDLLITYRSAAVASASKVTPYADGTGVTTTVAPGPSAAPSAEFVMSSITIPANKIGPNGWVELFYSTERTAGAGTLATRIRVGNAVSGTVIAAPTAGTRMVAMAALVSQGATNLHRSWAPVNTGDHIGTTVTATDTSDTTANLTFYLTGVLSNGDDTASKYYFKAVVHNPDA